MTLTKEQLQKLGGSDAPAIVGMSRWKRAIDIYSRVVDGVEQDQTPAMRRGLRLEPYVREVYQEETGATLLGPKSLEFPGRPFLRASLDDLADRDGERRVVELKTASWHMAKEWDGEEVPTEYLLQVQWYLRASGLSTADLAVLFSIDDVRIKTVHADAELQDMLVDAACRFWVDHIQKRVPPPPDASESYRSYLARRFPKPTHDVLQSTPQIDALAVRLREAQARFESVSDEIEQAQNALKAVIGDAEGVHGRWGKISWRSNRDYTRTDWKELAQSLGPSDELVRRHTNTVPGARVFRTTWSKS